MQAKPVEIHEPAGLDCTFGGWQAIARCSCGTSFQAQSDMRAWAENAAMKALKTHMAFFAPEQEHNAVD